MPTCFPSGSVKPRGGFPRVGRAWADEREPDSVHRRHPPQRRRIDRHLRDDHANRAAAADELHTSGDGVAEAAPVTSSVDLEEHAVATGEPGEGLRRVASNRSLQTR